METIKSFAICWYFGLNKSLDSKARKRLNNEIINCECFFFAVNYSCVYILTGENIKEGC